jgi:ech hydrogenase subunit D
MIEAQPTTTVTPDTLVPKVQEMKANGYRLVQMCASRLPEGLEVNYTFDKDYAFVNLRILIAAESPSLPSVSGVYWSALLYENEMHDLYGIKFPGLVLDFQGNFYKVAKKHAFNEAAGEAPVKS